MVSLLESDADVKKKLESFLLEGSDWEDRETIEGSCVYVMRAPATKTRNAILTVKFSPRDKNGKPYKRNGLILSSKEQLIAFLGVMQGDSIVRLMEIVDEINGGSTKRGKVLGIG